MTVTRCGPTGTNQSGARITISGARLLSWAAFAAALAGASLFPSRCLAQWATLQCPDGTVYRDVRRDAGREEFCERLLPGSLKVENGPSRTWYSETHLGEEGNYKNGRKIGRWKECDRFGRCQDRVHDLLSAEEQARGVMPVVPVAFANGKYVFDFGSCWSTWVTRQTADSFMELNIGSGPFRCQVTYIPSAEKDRAAGNQGHYLCEIPFAVGVRTFDSLDLRSELPMAGLPQFCRRDEPPVTEPLPNGPASQVFAISVSRRILNSRTKQEMRVWAPVANIVDVECAAMTRRQEGPDVLTVRLNEYAGKLVLDASAKAQMKADACGGRFPLTALETTRDASGRTLFTYRLSRNRSTAERQRACIASQVTLQPACAGR